LRSERAAAQSVPVLSPISSNSDARNGTFKLSEKRMRDIVILQCTECKRRNYTTTRNKKQQQEKIQQKKYCKFCRKHTLHKETK
jgi:large subunit ribosomal protein L33